MEIKSGQMVIVTSGECSDYAIHILTRAKSDFDTAALKQQYLDDRPEQAKEYCLEEEEFIAWLTRPDGPLEEVPNVEYHFANYGTLE